MKNNILIIGGTGTLSSTVVRHSKVAGYDVTIMNRGSRNRVVPDGVHICKCDVHNRIDLENVIKDSRFDIIIDFVSRVPTDIEISYGTLQNHCKQYIFISSACVYRRAEGDFPIKEDSPKPNKDWNYNIEKHDCENTLIQMSQTAESYYTIVRPYITYDEERIPFGIAPAYKYHRTIIERIRNDKPMFLWDEGKITTTLTHVEDFAKALVGLFLNAKAENQDFHITGDFRYTWKEFMLKLYEHLGKTPQIVYLSSKEISSVMPNYKGMLQGDRNLDAIFDNSKIKEAVPGLTFDIDLDEGLERILKYYAKCSSYDYDYMYDAQIDRIVHQGQYVQYINDDKGGKKLYMLYRHLPFKLAKRINKFLF